MVKKVVAKLSIWLALLVMYAPILLLIVYSFTEADQIGSWTGFSFGLYSKLFQSEPIMDAVKNTILIAGVSSVLSTILGTIGAIGIFYSKRRTKALYSTVNQIPVLNAEIVTALSLTILFVFIFNVVGLKGQFGFFTLLMGHMVLSTPFVVLSVIPKLTQMDPNIYEAALDLGATPRQALFKVIIPEISTGITSGLLLSVTLSLDDYIITAFTRDSAFQTLSTYIYGNSRIGSLAPVLRALSTLIFLLIVLVLVIINFTSKKKSKGVSRNEKDI